MMRKLAEFMLRSPSQEVLVLTLAMLLCLLLSPLSYLIGGAPLALLVLRKGVKRCLRSAAISLLIMAIVVGITVPAAQFVILVFALMVWLPVMTAGWVLRATESQAMMILVCAAIAGLISISIHANLGDAEAWWRNYTLTLIDMNFQGRDASILRDIMHAMIPYMNALMMAVVSSNIAISVLLARWWQSLLFFPGAFKKEFMAIRMPMSLLGVLIVSLVLSLNQGGVLHAVGKDFLAIMTVIYSLQGLARVHRGVEEKGKNQFIITFMYFMIIIMTLQMAVILALLGVIDSLSGRSQKRDNKNQ